MSDGQLHLLQIGLAGLAGVLYALIKGLVRIYYMRQLRILAVSGNEAAAQRLLALAPPEVSGGGPVVLLALAGSGALAGHLAGDHAVAHKSVPTSAQAHLAQRAPEREPLPGLPDRPEDVVLWRRRP